ncbi:TPA: fibronectin binding protein [Streptococcus pyogenes]|uniref:serum opacification factor n=1 Tax=Streptococcus pyogenes TaxID=1314 RepID=UPI000E0201AF|nr:serum opacification factor [Streptococcus pyogenes]SUO40245.1 Serum opacity factor [Streptococcus pyogenes]VTR16171.1 Serum opacity factor [Streptococcus pyogenes]HEP1571989.1 fibronectin binding protein [Streptococcus pyogenes]HEP1577357.1 fibronectin binding protein [Streptococcus pyogenes]HEQ0802890.1 fibronectin binding protein [Streptococcus pyogenes]
MTNCKYKLRKLSVGLVSVGTMLIAPTVLGQEVSTTGSTETSAASTASVDATTSGTTASGASGESSDASVASSEGSQGSESAPASPQPQPQAQTAPAATSASSKAKTEEQTPKAATSSTPSTPAASSSSNSNQEASAETEPQMMDVEKYTVDKESSELKVKDGKKPKNENKVDKDTKLIRNRDGEQRDIFDIKREVKTNADGTIDVTVTVTPKEIDKGADVMALLDVSQKMTKENFDKAKEQIKKMVTTLTGEPTDGKENRNRRNSVRLMTFYRKISEPIDLSGKTSEEVEKELDNIWDKVKKEDWDWGVDLQGAIHKARDIFKKEKESKKRQHIVLFSQGESTFSYDINDKDKNNTVRKNRITGKVTTSNPLFPWLPIFNHTNQKAEVIDDVDKLLDFAEKMGISLPKGLRAGVQAIGLSNSFLSTFTGSGLTEYLTLNEYGSDILKEKQFDYTKRVGEGYYYHSYSKRTHGDKMPFEKQIREVLEQFLPKIESREWAKKFIDIFGLQGQKVDQIGVDVIMKVINSIFYSRQYYYYNHNLSAIAEAKMAQEEGITFYSVDVTDLKPKRAKRQAAVLQKTTKKESEEDRNNKFDGYLKKMSEGGKEFFNDVDEADKFKDTLTEVTVTETFENSVSVENQSWKVSSNSNHKENVKYTNAQKNRNWFSSEVKESLTWTISKEQLKQAFEDGKPLTLTYKLKVDNNKLKKALDDKRKNRPKRSIPTENENSVTEKIISNTVNYKINKQEVKGNKLDDVKLTYTKETVPVPDVEGEVVPIPEKPLVEPMTPLYPAIPNYPTPQLPKDEDLEISGGHGPIVDIVEDTGTGVEGGAQNGVVSTQENKDPIVDITEDTQPGMSGSNDATVVEEDTAPKRPDVLVGGQSDPIDITEDTQPSVSGSNDATVVEEDTAPKRPDILVGGQSDPIDITEDTQPGMSGSNDATVIEEDTKPKRFFHFDNEPQAPEKPKEQPSLSLPQAPVYKAAHHLPASGDKREASFTIVALTIIGAAGLLSKKRRDTEEN